MKRNVPIVFITDDNYVIPTAVTIKSIIENKKEDTVYDIFVVSTCLSDENIKRFSEFNGRNVSVNTIKVELGELEHLHEFQKNGICQATPSALLKFKLPELFKNYDKILYLDGDILVLGDLQELYDIELGSHFVAAAHDTGKLYSNKSIFKEIPDYFNSGVMLLNLLRCRQENITDALIATKKASTDMSLMDQNVLNTVFANNVKIIDIKYNFLLVNLLRSRGKWSIDEINRLFHSKYKTLGEIENSALIIHFSSKDKPWKFVDGLYSELWYNFFKNTPFADKALERVSFKKDNPDILVSLTSYPARIKTVNQTIETILKQTYPADKVVLWLAKEQFPNGQKNLPKELLKLTKYGLVIEWCEDLKSYKKIIPALQKYPDSIIITADDDILYPEYWIESLVDAYNKDKNTIWAHRAHKILIKRKKLLPYVNWKQNIQNSPCEKAAYSNFCTTGAGVLFPPKCFFQDVCNKHLFMTLCPNADDIWLWSMLVLNEKKIGIVKKTMGKLKLVAGSQDSALAVTNVFGGENDIQIKRIITKYPRVLRRVLKEKQFHLSELHIVKHWKKIFRSHSRRYLLDKINMVLENNAQLQKLIQDLSLQNVRMHDEILKISDKLKNIK